MTKGKSDQKYFGLKPRSSEVSIPLPQDEELPPEVVRTLAELPKLNNLRMFARVPRCFNTLMSFIDEIFNHGNFDKRLRECMYIRISYVCGLYYELRHNLLFARNLGMTEAEIAALTSEVEVNQLDDEANLVCKAAEEITKNISISDKTLKQLLDRFDVDTTSELILLVSWFNMLIRYVESMRVPYEQNLERIITGPYPVKLKSQVKKRCPDSQLHGHRE
jgi:alkylhydroperoxidase family enzyme